MKQIMLLITTFTMSCIVLIPAIGLWWLTEQLGIVWVFWTVLVLSVFKAIVNSR